MMVRYVMAKNLAEAMEYFANDAGVPTLAVAIRERMNGEDFLFRGEKVTPDSHWVVTRDIKKAEGLCLDLLWVITAGIIRKAR